MVTEFVYVTYIATTPEKLWEALTASEYTEQYFFGSSIQSDWQEGSEVTYSRNGKVTDYGQIVRCSRFKNYPIHGLMWGRESKVSCLQSLPSN